jgi:hypothetical protein
MYLDKNKSVRKVPTKQYHKYVCGSVCRIGDKARHNKSIKHQFLENSK